MSNTQSKFQVLERTWAKVVATAIIFTASAAVHSQPNDDSLNAAKPELSRAEVRADLALWIQSGLHQYDFYRSYNVDTPDYQAAKKQYLRLRYSEQFQLEIQKASRD